MPLALRRATADDVEAIKAVVDAAYRPWIAVLGREPGPMRADCAEAVRRSLIDMLEVDGEPAALIEMRAKADHLLVVNVAVDPRYQKRGLGRNLMAHAETVAASLGLGEMRLYTNTLMASNIALYSGLGYRLGREEAFMGGFVVHMSKTL